MHKCIIILLTLVFGLTINPAPALAAFPPPQAHSEVKATKAKLSILPFKQTRTTDHIDDPSFGIASFVCGLLSLPLMTIGLALNLLTGGIALLLIGGICGIVAVVLGAMGFNKKMKGLAIAGFVLGLISVLYFIPIMVAASLYK